MERRLGKGLGSLLGSTPPPPSPTTGDPSGLEVSQIRPNPFQPRKVFDSEGLEELRDSITNHGVLQPIVVRRRADGYELISGERRWRASKLAGKTTIPAVVREDVSDDEMLELALVENVQRRDLNPLERAQGFQGLMKGLELSQEGVAKRVGLKRATVANHLRLLDLPSKVQDALREDLISMGHARALLGLGDATSMVDLLERTVRGQLSVREVEKAVRDAQNPPKPTEEPEKEIQPAQPWVRDLEARLRERLGTKATIQNGPDYRGKIVIDYYSREALDRLVEQLLPPKAL